MQFNEISRSPINGFIVALLLSASLHLSWQHQVSSSQTGSQEILEASQENLEDQNPTILNWIFSAQGSTKQLPPPHGEHSCYPPGSNGVSQYLIGYGSLMQTASKDRTHPNTGDNIPIRVYGFSRSWTCKGESVGYSTTYLGSDVSNNKSAYFNGVIFKLPSASALANYDTRESFYCREEIPMSRIQLLTNKTSINSKLPTGQYWLYVTRPEYHETPSDKYPIVQSYVDTFLSGCLELETNYKLPGFAEECVFTTSDWENPWKNDRIYPRRPFQYQPMAGRIDRLLNATVHDAFEKIVIEG